MAGTPRPAHCRPRRSEEYFIRVDVPAPAIDFDAAPQSVVNREQAGALRRLADAIEALGDGFEVDRVIVLTTPDDRETTAIATLYKL